MQTKKKEGVYARPWVNKLTSSLKDQFNRLKGFEAQALTGMDMLLVSCRGLLLSPVEPVLPT